MSTGKPSTPVASPKAVASNTKTPSPPNSTTKKRLSLRTPDHYKSPLYHGVTSPFGGLNSKSSGNHLEDSHERKSKLQKTPQYFSSARKLFDSSPTHNDETDVTSISSQLKMNLSNALGKLQHNNNDHKITFTELKFDSDTSPTKKQKNDLGAWTPSNSTKRTNLNLRTLETQNSPPFKSDAVLQQSPIIFHESEEKIPSPDEESSAHNALLAALSRQQRRKSRSSFNNGSKRKSIDDTLSKDIKLPPLNITFENQQPPKNEQDAVLSLMSLSSPQQVKFSHSRSQSLNGNVSPISRASSVHSPNKQIPPILPPLSKMIKRNSNTNNNSNFQKDDDETDFEANSTDETDDEK
ncbi:unnamed protein product [Candida verbasci]|uniref:Uncharacterized protein n=1 Tax=Candida verbasci TaxID=1227364 RepID=A0A9W4TR69_9ASCO|nr:unnamed protein product [Candida verbasci]